MSTTVTGASPIGLLGSLINAAEKASNIARICRSREELLALLVQEKCGDEANERFEHDFKTLADVLIQETIKHDVGNLYPVLRSRIKGEESPIFTNTSGETVSVAVGANSTETANCLASVLNGHPNVAQILAAEVHRTVTYTSDDLQDIPELPEDLNYEDFGIWIDPIDATAEYISGNSGGITNSWGIVSDGLECVTVLIGVYECSTGQPVIGVISQPFHKIDSTDYQSRIYWGVYVNQLQASNCRSLKPKNSLPLCILSNSEEKTVLKGLQQHGYDHVFSAGAGYKALKVITSEADLYILSKHSTFKWDTCAPQAILRSLGGNIYDFCETFRKKCPVPVTYLEVDGTDSKRNNGGLIAVRDLALLEVLMQQPLV